MGKIQFLGSQNTVFDSQRLAGLLVIEAHLPICRSYSAFAIWILCKRHSAVHYLKLILITHWLNYKLLLIKSCMDTPCGYCYCSNCWAVKIATTSSKLGIRLDTLARLARTHNLVPKQFNAHLIGSCVRNKAHKWHSHLQELAGYKSRFLHRDRNLEIFYKCGHKNLTNYRDQHHAANRNTSCDYFGISANICIAPDVWTLEQIIFVFSIPSF